MAPRKAISKKLRFEVFKRDAFTCQYCGRSAPDVVLNVDHINPVAKGGGADILNLITACVDCNQGKRDRTIDDRSILEKQKKQLAELSERREQLKLMVKWRDELLKLENIQVDEIEKIFSETTNRTFTPSGKKTIGKLIKKYGFSEVMESVSASLNNYFKADDDSSAGKAFDYIGRICACRQKETDSPHLKELYYIRGIVRNRMYCNEPVCLDLLKKTFDAGCSIELLKDVAVRAKNWTEYKDLMEDLVF